LKIQLERFLLSLIERQTTSFLFRF